ncbi:AMP-binding protein [Dactylosporangium sp. CA-052675]|uniref:AMP-binding protein n=1 Tax=Dactylosporangium sp. CA-052675 TaxID=3239927 RepID=UPI003D8A66DB
MRAIFARHADGSRVDSVADIIRRRAAATPALTAVIEPHRTTTFGALDERSNRVAQALIAAGVAPGDRVAYIGANAPEFLEVLYGATKAGAIATAVNNRLAPPEIAAILADAAPAVLITDSDVPAAVRTVRTGEPYEAWLSTVEAVDPGVPVGPDDTAVLFYTSGTTGRPKGIMLSGDNLGQALATMHYDMELTTTSVAMAPIPYFHSARSPSTWWTPCRATPRASCSSTPCAPPTPAERRQRYRMRTPSRLSSRRAAPREERRNVTVHRGNSAAGWKRTVRPPRSIVSAAAAS